MFRIPNLEKRNAGLCLRRIGGGNEEEENIYFIQIDFSLTHFPRYISSEYREEGKQEEEGKIVGNMLTMMSKH
jgi:hypothetical protein